MASRWKTAVHSVKTEQKYVNTWKNPSSRGVEVQDEKTRVRRYTENSTNPEYLQFKVLREDEVDVYKQNSPSELKKLAEQPPGTELTLNERNLIEFVGTDLDRSKSVEEIVGAPLYPPISPEIKDQLERLPSWLHSMVSCRLPAIENQYKDQTARFIRAIANRIDRKYRSQLMTGGNEDFFVIRGEGDRDYRENNQLNYYKLTDDDIEDDDIEGEDEDFNFDRRRRPSQQTSVAVRVATTANKWRVHAKKHKEDYWRPHHVSRANLKLRAALQTRAAYGDLATVAEDEDMLNVDHGVHSSDDDTIIDSKNYWTNANIFDEDETIQHAEARLNNELMHVKKLSPEQKEQLRKERENMENGYGKNKKKRKEKKKTKINSKDKKMKNERECRLFITKRGKRRKKRFLLSHGFRDESRLFNQTCGTFQKSPKRSDRIYRIDYTFHNYCVALVSWFWFKLCIIFIISLNAIVLLLETSEYINFCMYKVFGDYQVFVFEILDHVFVAIYLVEFLLKIYAHPYGYWRSGFNVFDFLILLSSLFKFLADWTNYMTELYVLNALMIIRSLRVLRGISFSVQLQVLVTALVNTIKTHCLSVVLLLILILFLTSIVAFFLFGKLLPEYFGSIGQGMLSLIIFLTIDGWTDVNNAIEKVVGWSGTIFILVCIVLGNFLFSNIFVAIIILNISEATDTFRDKQKEQRETVVRLKKEKVFRRQKLDLRQLLARQRTSAFTDFFSIGSQFQKMLRHDDLSSMTSVPTSALWIDSVYQSMLRSSHTSNILMNLHREMADNLVEQYRFDKGSKSFFAPIRRGRYNRYLKVKAKLSLIKQQIIKSRNVKQHSREIIGKM